MKLPDSKQRRFEIATIMQVLLGESPAMATRLAVRWEESMRSIAQNWEQAATMDLATALSRNDAYAGSEIPQLTRYLARQPRGIVLVTMHMGDYLQAFFSIVARLKDRPVCIVRRKTPTKEESLVFQKLADHGMKMVVVRSYDKSAALHIHRHLRKGGLAALLFDLPGSFGETAELKLLGQAVRWVKGPIITAARAGALVVPFVTFRNPQPCCDVHPIMLFNQRRPADSDIQQSAQALALIAERYIRRHPEQWLHWHLVPEMVATPND